MLRNHMYQEGDTVLVAIPAGWWEEGGEATKFPFATQIDGNLELEAEVVSFVESKEDGDLVKVENVRGEVITVDISWIREMIARREDERESK